MESLNDTTLEATKTECNYRHARPCLWHEPVWRLPTLRQDRTGLHAIASTRASPHYHKRISPLSLKGLQCTITWKRLKGN